MKKVYEVIRIFPHGWTNTNLDTLENFLNEGYEILRMDSIKHKDGYTFNDYILMKIKLKK